MDSIADFLTIIRNGYLAKKREVRAVHSTVKETIAQILARTGYVEAVRTEALTPAKKDVVVTLRYPQGKPALNKLIRISKSGRRVYQPRTHLPYVLSGRGIAIISTSAGMMTADEARKQGLGGEVIAQLW